MKSLMPGTYAQSFQAFRTIDTVRIINWVNRARSLCPFSNGSILVDLGCGVGRFTEPLAAYASHIYGIDKDTEMLSLASKKNIASVSWLCGDAEAIPLASKTIDIVFASMLMEHVSNKKSLFLQIGRILKSGGSLILRTMLPEDIEKTTWYNYLDEAKQLEAARTINKDEIEHLSSLAGMSIKAIASFQDDVDSAIANNIETRLAKKSYEILRRIDDKKIMQACQLAGCAIQNPLYKETMSSSLLVIGNE